MAPRCHYDSGHVIEGREVLESQDEETEVAQATYVYSDVVDDVVQMRREGAAQCGVGIPACDYFFHQDDQGNVLLVTDASGAAVERYDYDDFGTPTILDPTTGQPRATSAIGNRYLFTGREWDADTRLYHYRFRDYDPSTGRFLQRDPIGVWGDLANLGNGTAYVGNNPWSAVDPYGLEGESCTWYNPLTWSAPQPNYPSWYNPVDWIKYGYVNPALEWSGLDKVPTAIEMSRNKFNGSDLPKMGYTADEAEKEISELGTEITAEAAMQLAAATVAVATAGMVIEDVNSARKAEAVATAARLKPINLPSWKSVTIDMDHVLSGHTSTGSRYLQGLEQALTSASDLKTLFPANWTNAEIEKHIRNAYRHAKRIGEKGDRLVLEGTSGGLKIWMYLNRKTGLIETAFPAPCQ